MARIHSATPWETGVQKCNYSFKWNGLKRSLDFINIQDVPLLLPESKELKDSLDSKCQVVKLGSYSPCNIGFYRSSRPTPSLWAHLGPPTHSAPGAFPDCMAPRRTVGPTLPTNTAKAVTPSDG